MQMQSIKHTILYYTGRSKTPDGSIRDDIQTVISKWYRDYPLLYSDVSTINTFDENFAEITRNHINSMESEVGNFVCESMKVADLISQISSLKVQQAERKAKTNISKAQDWDAIPAKVLKMMPVLHILLHLFSLVLPME